MNWCAYIKLDIQQDPCVGRMTLDILWQVDRGCQQFLDKFQFDPGRLLESKLWKFHACSFDFHQQWNNNQFVHRCIGVLDALSFQDGCHEYEVQMWPGKSHRVGSNYLFLIRYSSNGPNGVKLQSCRVAISQRVPKEVIGPVLSDIHWIPICTIWNAKCIVFGKIIRLTESDDMAWVVENNMR